jgi:hypothetical protein
VSTDLLGVWKSADKREERYIYVTSVSAQYAYGFACDARGRKSHDTIGKPGRPTRVLLNRRGDGLARYRRDTTGGQR